MAVLVMTVLIMAVLIMRNSAGSGGGRPRR
jgi:hypothetical protein